MVTMVFKGKGGVQDDAKVACQSGWGDGGG